MMQSHPERLSWSIFYFILFSVPSVEHQQRSWVSLTKLHDEIWVIFFTFMLIDKENPNLFQVIIFHWIINIFYRALSNSQKMHKGLNNTKVLNKYKHIYSIYRQIWWSATRYYKSALIKRFLRQDLKRSKSVSLDPS